MNLSIPLFRAKKQDSDEYVDGYYFHQEWTGNYPNEDAEEREEKIKHFICGFTTYDIWDDEEGHFKFMGIDEIDSTTLAIHFPDMLDSQGNKIFASLSEDGKGGDVFKHSVNCRLDSPRPHDGTYWIKCESPLIYKNFSFCLAYKIEDYTPLYSEHKITNRKGYSSFEKNLEKLGIQE